MHLAMVLCLDPGQVVAAVLISRGFAMFVVQRQVWYRALFNVTSVMGATVAASYVFRLLGGNIATTFESGQIVGLVGPVPGRGVDLLQPVCSGSFGDPRTDDAGLSVACLARELRLHGRAGRNGGSCGPGSGHGSVLPDDGWAGLAVFLVPMVLVRYTSVRYIALRQSQGALISAERLAAKGEIAAEVGHDIKNFLHGISAHATSWRRRP